VRARRAALVTCLAVLCVPVVTVLMVLTHEIGHTAVARLLGDGRATFRIYGHDCVGCNLYDSQRLTPWGNVAVSLGGVWGTMLLTIVAVAVLAWRGRPRWVPRWLLAEIIVICFGGDLVWQFVQAVQQLPVPAREPVGWGLGYTDLDAATSFGSQATGWSHQTIAVIGFSAAALYTITLAIAVRWAWRRASCAGSDHSLSSAPASHAAP
jgi:Peptidase M50B-like